MPVSRKGVGRLPPGEALGVRPETQPSLDGPMDGALVRAYRLWCNLTQKEFGAQLGYSAQAIIAWEIHERQPARSAEALRNLLYGHLCRRRHISVYKGAVVAPNPGGTDGQRADTPRAATGTRRRTGASPTAGDAA